MNERWNLDPIYTGFDDENYISDMAAAAETVKELTTPMQGSCTSGTPQPKIMRAAATS